jgi:hypothetical protein
VDLLPRMTSKRQVRGRHGRYNITGRDPGRIVGADRSTFNRVGFVDELWASRLGDVRTESGTTRDCRWIWYNRLYSSANEGAAS